MTNGVGFTSLGCVVENIINIWAAKNIKLSLVLFPVDIQKIPSETLLNKVYVGGFQVSL